MLQHAKLSVSILCLALAGLARIVNNLICMMWIAYVFPGSTFFTVLAFCYASSDVKYERYAVATYTRITNDETRSSPVESKLECAMICTHDKKCCTTNYNKEIGICSMNSMCCPEIERSDGDVVLQKLPDEDNHGRPLDRPKDCSHLVDSPPGVYTIYPDSSNEFDVYCEGGWTIFQRHKDAGFYFAQNWNSYKTGFGDLRYDHWLGNDKLHILTSNNGTCGRKLRIILSDFDDEEVYAVYQIFHIRNELSKYMLFVGGYDGNNGADALQTSNARPFSTIDQDNDYNDEYDCAQHRQAGWWFDNCGLVCLNGPIEEGLKSWRSMHWYDWRLENCLKTSVMMLK